MNVYRKLNNFMPRSLSNSC